MVTTGITNKRTRRHQTIPDSFHTGSSYADAVAAFPSSADAIKPQRRRFVKPNTTIISVSTVISKVDLENRPVPSRLSSSRNRTVGDKWHRMQADHFQTTSNYLTSVTFPVETATLLSMYVSMKISPIQLADSYISR